MSNNTSSSIAAVLFWLVTILFIGLKLTGHITWSWWWVLSPVLACVLLVLAGLIIFVVADKTNLK